MDKVKVSIEVDKKIVEVVTNIVNEYGLGIEEATKLFYKEVIKANDLPFHFCEELSEKSRKVIEDAHNGINVSGPYTLEEFIKYYEELDPEEDDDE